jgi:hypothetical protein
MIMNTAVNSELTPQATNAFVAYSPIAAPFQGAIRVSTRSASARQHHNIGSHPHCKNSLECAPQHGKPTAPDLYLASLTCTFGRPLISELMSRPVYTAVAGRKVPRM